LNPQKRSLKYRFVYLKREHNILGGNFLTEYQSGDRLPLTRIQRLIGQYMLQSKQTKASAYLTVRADLTELTRMRKAYCKQVNVRATTQDFFICAIARVIQAYPLMAAAFRKDLQFWEISEHIGVGFAVAAPQGLVVPVVQKAEQKSLPQLAAESEDLLKKARANKLLPDDFDGANIVLSGLGMYGIESFYAISPPSALGIISIGNIEDTVVPVDDGFRVRKKMCVSLAFDQCIVDEFYAAQFLNQIVKSLEDPWSLTRD
jgi:pyruvate dehydrogenase E2 component (dihydrolipoamide acetyltransferase)